MSKNTTQCPQPGLEPALLAPESSELTKRTPRTSQTTYLSDIKLLQLEYVFFMCRFGIKACVLLVPLLGLTWLFGLLSPLHIAFAYIFTIFNSTQVMFLFAILGLTPDKTWQNTVGNTHKTNKKHAGSIAF